MMCWTPQRKAGLDVDYLAFGGYLVGSAFDGNETLVCQPPSVLTGDSSASRPE